MGPAPIIKILSMSVRFGIMLWTFGLGFLRRRHVVNKYIKQGSDIPRPRIGLRVPLEPIDGLGFMFEALRTAIKSGNMRELHFWCKAIRTECVVMILAGDISRSSR